MYSFEALAAFLIYVVVAVALIGGISAVLVLSVKMYREARRNKK